MPAPSITVRSVFCRVAFLVAAMGSAADRACAQPDLPAAGAVSERSATGMARPTHGWIAIPDDTGAVIAHVPPRSVGSWSDGRAHGSIDGTVRKAAHLDWMPAALGAVGDRVYVIHEQSTVAGEPVRRSVLSLIARPPAVGDYWYFEPEGHLNTHPSLPPGGTLRAVIGTPLGLAVLLDETPDGGGTRLSLLRDDRWSDIPLPVPVAPGKAFLLATPAGLALLTMTDHGAADIWDASQVPASPPVGRSGPVPGPFDAKSGDDDSSWPGDARTRNQPFELQWRRSTVAADGSLLELDLRRTRFFEIAGLLTYVTDSPGGPIVIGTATADTSFEMAHLPAIGEPFAAVPLDAPGRIVMTWMAEGQGNTPQSSASKVRAKTHPEVREVSVHTGRVLYSGPGQGDSPVSPQEIKLLAGALVGIMTVVLLLVLRREPDGGVFHLPPGTALAEPGRRFVAALLDLFIAVIIAARLWEMPVADLVAPVALISSQSLWVIGTALVIGLAIGTGMEWLTGRTLGKLLTGCEVIDTRPTDPALHRPHLWQSLVRNSLKWLVAPVAALGLMDAQRRHRGDSFSRSAVVIRVVEEEPESPDAKD